MWRLLTADILFSVSFSVLTRNMTARDYDTNGTGAKYDFQIGPEPSKTINGLLQAAVAYTRT